ncbi:MAG: hypothetical protein HN509_14685 [Halobacteriovoraceae bacterium]|jgi:hypothetical protein|nr:hypothetical protein [Halobacteriovoraceae bacterium]MBT5094198.1 hypothetical protein [Halobacteriovoraceae bacterium]
MNTTTPEFNATPVAPVNQDIMGPEIKIKHLAIKIKKLNKLCNQLDPYLPIPEDTQAELREFHITDFFDPFTITNKLLVLLEDSIEELHKLEGHPDTK